MTHFLEEAERSANLAVKYLRAALNQADPVQAMLLLPLIKRACKLAEETQALRDAIISARNEAAS